MITLPGYKIEAQLHTGEKSIVYRAKKEDKSFILKYLNNEYPTNPELEIFRKEYETLKKFSLENSIQAIGVESYKNSLVLVFEDIGASSLASILNEKKSFETREFLEIAIAATKALAEIHEHQIIHKDIKPHNIVYNPETKVLKLIDFGSASLLTRESPEINMKNNLEGTLAYISPEQTGRMNCNVGYRTDFYSLGVTFYQMLTGSLPFDFTDPSELVHAHIALNPESPSEKKKEIPSILSDIILKLMEKSPENRYQTAEGLLYDLEECQKRSLLNSIPFVGDMVKFPLGTKDFSSAFKIPEKLYGREAEIATMFELFRRNAEGTLALVSGQSGIGKTALINEVQKPIVEAKGHFIKGKYDKFKRNIPYRALIFSFQDLTNQILSESEAKISYWKKEILEALGANGRVITDVIPELEAVIGEQPQVMELPASESQNRFNLVFQNFIKVFCREDHPLVIFLDDLQWADLPSIQLLQSLLTGEFSYLFIIFSFRSNEVDATHPFSTMMEEVKKTGREGVPIFLEPLKEEDVNLLVAETFRLEKEKSLELAKALYTKTNGNPFFVNELFTSFYKEEFVYYKNGKWNWDISKINSSTISDNVIDLMVGKINKLPKDKIDLLKLAACVGNTLWLDVFIQIRDNLQTETITTIEYLANEGYFIVGGNDVKFAHDRVLESVYTLLSEEERTRNHYKIGKVYLEQVDIGKYELEDRIFSIVNQLNQGIVYMSQVEKDRLIDLNILAGDKALASSAYETALESYRIAKSLSPEKSWEGSYDKAFNIYTKLARLEYLNGNTEEAEKYFEIILSNVKSDLEKVSVYEIKIPLYVAKFQFQQALEIGIKGLEILGVSFPEVHDPSAEFGKIFQLLGERKPEDIINVPLTLEQHQFASMRVLVYCIIPAFVSMPSMFPLIIGKMVSKSLEHGNFPVSPVGYVWFGNILSSGIGNYELGYSFGKLAIEIVDKYNLGFLKCAIYFVFFTMINVWKKHARESIPYLLESYQSGLAFGDLQFASYAINHYTWLFLLTRVNLESVKNKFLEHDKILAKLKQQDTTLLYNFNFQFIINLSGDSPNLLSLDGDRFIEKDILESIQVANNLSALLLYYTYKTILSYFFGEPKEAFKYASSGEPLLSSAFGLMNTAEYIFWYSLSCIAILESPESTEEDKAKYLEQINKNQERMKIWGENCPANYSHKYHIVEGELASIKGERYVAQEHFEKAITLAKEHEYTLEEAIANELYAKLWTKYGNEVFAKANLIEAHYCYEKWGCKPKVKLLEEKHQFLKQARQKGRSGISKDSTISSSETTAATVRYSHGSGTGTGSSMLDMNTVLKASQAISTEIQLDKLLERMMFILFESAGAAKGSFILANKNKETGAVELIVEAEGDANLKKVSVLMHTPLREADLPRQLITFVSRIKQELILDDAIHVGNFTKEEYIVKNQAKSILCYPIQNQGKLIGIVYLENNLAINAFTSDRLEVLKVLSSQVSVSIENSLLYANLEEKVEERTRDLNQALVEVRGLKEQQDGDYFLNTLLIEPLGQNNAFSKQVGIEFFIKQKKNFIFRRKEYELGGDINISENIELQEKKYIVFLNGDAMGKSIQGAGGVIVLGTVFKSILQRTISTSAGKNVYPERWIKNAFIEMHKAFESFDGSMLMSIVFGLIDEITGTMYFMNAEHPDIVLYRDGIPSFIENPNQYRKLGTQGQTGNICVEVLSLRPDDVIILGSDGRDDIILGKDSETGSDIINQDEHLFLTHVKKADGDLERIYEEIKNAGKQMDDISLLKIHYKGITADQEKLDQDLKLLEDYKELGKYKEYAEVGSKVISNYPHLTNFLLEMSHAYKELGQYEKAIDFGERLRLRDAKNTVNLLNLVESYKGLGKKERAKAILDACLKARPEDERFLKLKEDF